MDKPKQENKTTKTTPSWVFILFIVLCAYLAVVPFINATLSPSVQFSEEHRGILESIDANYATGVYGSTYKTTDNIEFTDGTKYFNIKMMLPQSLTADTVIVCGTYTVKNIFPTFSDGLTLDSSGIVPIDQLVCTTEDSIANVRKPRFNYIFIVLGIGIWYTLKKRRKGDGDSNYPNFPSEIYGPTKPPEQK